MKRADLFLQSLAILTTLPGLAAGRWLPREQVAIALPNSIGTAGLPSESVKLGLFDDPVPEMPAKRKSWIITRLVYQNFLLSRTGDNGVEEVRLPLGAVAAFDLNTQPTGNLTGLGATGLPFHPFTELFPALEGQQYQLLKKSINDSGQQEPIVLYNGYVLDGRARDLICRELDRRPKTIEWHRGSPLEFLLAKNVHHRHLNSSQKALIAARLAVLFKGEAKARMLRGTAADPGAKLHQGRSNKLAGERVGVSARSVATAAVVLAKGCPELILAVENRSITISSAANFCGLPHDEQFQSIAKDRERKSAEEERVRLERQEAKARKKPSPPQTLAEDGSVANATVPEVGDEPLRDAVPKAGTTSDALLAQEQGAAVAETEVPQPKPSASGESIVPAPSAPTKRGGGNGSSTRKKVEEPEEPAPTGKADADEAEEEDLDEETAKAPKPDVASLKRAGQLKDIRDGLQNAKSIMDRNREALEELEKTDREILRPEVDEVVEAAASLRKTVD